MQKFADGSISNLLRKSGWFKLGSWMTLAGLMVSLGHAQPANDNFTNAVPIFISAGSLSGTNIGATVEVPCEPTFINADDFADVDNSVWYQWIAPFTGTATFNTLGSDFDTVLAVYTTPTDLCDNNLQLVAANDNFTNAGALVLQSQVSFTVVAGTTYYVSVNGNADTFPPDDSGSFVLNWSLANSGVGSIASIPSGTFKFTAKNYEVSETERQKRITVTRTGGYNGRVLVGLQVAALTYSNTFTTNTPATTTWYTTITTNGVVSSTNTYNNTVNWVNTYQYYHNGLGSYIVTGSSTNGYTNISTVYVPPSVTNMAVLVNATGSALIPTNIPAPAGVTNTVTGPTTTNIFTTNIFVLPPVLVHSQGSTYSTNGFGTNIQRVLISAGGIFTTNAIFTTSIYSNLLAGVGSAVTGAATNYTLIYSNVVLIPVTIAVDSSGTTNISATYSQNPTVTVNQIVASAGNADFTPVSTTLTLDDYQMSVDYNLQLNGGANGPDAPQVPGLPRLLVITLTNAVLDSDESLSLAPPVLSPAGSSALLNILSTTYADGDTVPPTESVLNFSATAYSVDKEVITSNITVTVTRTGGSLGQAVSVNYATDPTANNGGYSPANSFPLSAGSDYATPNSDYTDVSGTLSWAANDTTPKTFTIPIFNNGLVEFNTDIYLKLFNPIPIAPVPYAEVGQVNEAWVTIPFDQLTAGQQPAGSVDRTWNVENSSGSNPPFLVYPGASGGQVYAVVEQPDGKAIVAGSFVSFDEHQYNRIVRLLSNGYQDPTFLVSPNLGANDFISCVALQPDGGILIGGNFTAFNGVNRYHIARLNTDGTLDATFNPGFGANGKVWSIATLPSGQIMIAGEFTSYNGVGVNQVARLNLDGSLDTNFNCGPIDGIISSVAVDSIGRVLIGGDFNTVWGVASGGVARLNVDGSLDTTFAPGIGTYNPITGTADQVCAVVVQPNGQILIGGSFSSFDLTSYAGIIRLNVDGTVDASFNPGTGTYNPVTGDDDTIYAITLQTDGSILIGGDFQNYNQTRRVGVARIFTDGTLDTSFMDVAYNQFAGIPNHYFNVEAVNSLLYPPQNTPNLVYSIGLEAGGNVIIGGSFFRVGGGTARDDIRNRSNVARLIGGATPGPGNIQFAYGSYSADEASGTLYVTLNRINGQLGAVSATFTTNALPAGPGVATPTDFTLNSTNPTWNTLWTSSWTKSVSSSGILNIPLTINNNTNLSGNLNAYLALLGPAGSVINLGGENIPVGAALGAASTAPLTIIDLNTKSGVFSFSAPSYIVVENVTNAVITVNRTGGSDGIVQVSYATANGTATSPANYTSVSGTLTFLGGVTSQTFTVPIVNGTTYASDKTLNLSLFNATGGAALGLNNATITIINDNYGLGQVNFSAPSYGTNENARTALISVTRLGGSQNVLTVTNSVTAGTAVNGVNFIGSTNVLTWNSGDVSVRTISIPIMDDGIQTSNLTINLSLYGANLNGSPRPQSMGIFTNATLTLTNVDFMGQVEFGSSVYSVKKNGGFALIPVVRVGGSAQTLSVNYFTYDVTASNGVNYIGSSGTLTFTNGQVSQTITVPIKDDGTIDGLRYLGVALTSALPATAMGSPTNAVLNIIDTELVNEPPGSIDVTYSSGAGFNNNVYALALQNNNQLLAGGDFTLANGVPREHIARLNANGTIDAGFLLPSSTSGASDSIRSIAVQKDGRILVGGFFTNFNNQVMNHVARLNTDGSIDSSFNIGSGADNPVYAVAQTFVNGVSETLLGGGFATVNGVAFNGVARLNTDGTPDLTFNPGGQGANATVYALAVQSDGKVVIGGDFTTYNGLTNFNHIARLNVDGSADLTFNPFGSGAGDSVRAIAIQLDGRILIAGVFTNVNGIALSHIARLNADGSVDTSFQPGVGASDSVFSIAIQSDNRIILGGSFTHFSGVTRNYITRLNPDGSVDPTINFGTGANGFVAALVVQDDTIAGYPTNVPDEKILLGGGFTQYNGQARNHLARIYGGSIAGSGAFQFSSANYQVNENGTNVLITVLRTGGTSGTNANGSGDIFVPFATSAGTAVAGINYSNVSSNLDFPDGEVIQTIAIPVLDDGVITSNLTVNLALSNPTAPAQLGNQPTALLTIINDDSSVSFSSATYSVPKNTVGGVAAINLVRLGGTNATASVLFTTTSGGTATVGTDYIPVAQVVTFNPGVASVMVPIPVINNGLPEGNTTVTMQLLDAAGTILASPTNAILTIIDTVHAPGQLNFSATNYSITEGGGVGYTNAIVTVTRTFGSAGIVSVGFNTIDGTATAGIKYNATNGVLTFGDGETTKSFAVQVLNTATAEGPETVLLNLSNPTGGASLAEPTNSTLTILNTNIGLAFVLATNQTTEPSGISSSSVTLNVVRFNNTNGITTVYYSTTNGTAVAGTNFVGITNAVLTFNPGDAVKPIVITTLHDPRVTGDLFFKVGLSNPSSGAQLTSPSVTTVIDHDSDAGISFLTDAQNVFRNAGYAILYVICSNPSVGPMAVNYGTGGGSAVPGTDYTSTSGTLIFTNGQSINTILVPLVVNNLVQSNKTFNVTLSSPTAPGQLVAPSVETVTIIATNTPYGLSFSTPISITGSWGSTNINNSTGAPELGDPSIAGSPPNAPVWLKWTAPADGEVTVDTIGSLEASGLKLDTVLAVYTGSSLGTLNQVAANDDVYPNYPETQFNEAAQNIYDTNQTLTLIGETIDPITGTISYQYETNNGTFSATLQEYIQPYAGPSALRFNARAGTTYYFAADSKYSSTTILSGTTLIGTNLPITSVGVGNIALNWAYHSSGVFRFATENIDLTGIVQTNGNPMLLYQCSETEGSTTSHRVEGPVTANEYDTTLHSYYYYDVYGLLVTVTRVAGSSGRVMVDYTTVDGNTNLITNGDIPAMSTLTTSSLGGVSSGGTIISSINEPDYSPVSGTLIFDDFEMSKTFYIPIDDDDGISRPNRDFTVVLSNPRLDPAESGSVSAPRVDPTFGQALCRILDCDIDPNGPSYTSLLTTNTVPGTTNTVVTTNMLASLIPTNALFNFSKANYRVPRDVQSGYWGTTPVTVYVNRMGTNRSNVTIHYRFDNYFLDNADSDDQNIYFPLQAGSDYATPTPATTGRILGTNSDFNGVGGDSGTLTFPGGNNNPFQSQPIHFNVKNNQLTQFNKDIHIGIFELDKNNNEIQDGMVAETTVTILFDDLSPPAGSVDEFYNPDFAGNMAVPTNNVGSSVLYPGTDPLSEVYTLALDPNNKSIIGGSFSTYSDGNNTYTVNGIARLNADGSLDTSFNANGGVNTYPGGQFIRSLALTPNDQVVIGGDFTSYNGVQRNSIARLNSNGSLDTAFTPGAGANGTIWSVLLQSDGKILVGGDFTTFNSTPRNYIARLNTDGSLDATFDPSNLLTGPVYSLAVAQSTLYNITRTSNGTNSEDDQPISLPGVTAGTLTVNYNFYNIPTSPEEMRIFYGDTNVNGGTGVLLYDTGSTNGAGTIVLPFGPTVGTTGLLTTNLLTIVMNQGGSTNTLVAWTYKATINAVQNSLGVVAGGRFGVKGQNYVNIARLNSDGSLDTTFNPGTGPDATVMALAWQLNGQIIAGGAFQHVNGSSYNRLVRLNNDGSLDSGFFMGTGLDNTVYSITLQPLSGNIYVGGSFTSYNGTHRLGLARLYSDGTLDTTFLDAAYNQFAGLPRILFADAPGTIYASALQADGNVMIGGAFQEVGGGQADYYVRGVLETERGLQPSTTDPNLWVSEGGAELEPKTRDGVRNRSNVARLVGGATAGPGNIGMVASSYAVNKTQLIEPVTLVRTNGSLGYASANFAVLPGLAQSGLDYSYGSVAPLYPIGWEYTGPTRMHSDGLFGADGLMEDIYGEYWKYGFNGPASVLINIINNPQSAGNLSAQLQMANPSGADLFYLGGQNIPVGVALGQGLAPLTLVDNTHQDGVFGFSSGSFTATNSRAVINILRTNSTIGTVSVSYQTTTNGSTAILGTDYQAASGSVTFNPGQSSNTFAVTILQNSSIASLEKTVNLQLFNIQDSSGGYASLGLSNAVLRIINPNFPGYLAFNTNNYIANLSAGTISFTVYRGVGSKGTLSVQYATANGTALNGVDYLGSTNTLTWNSGDPSPRTITVPLVNNSIVGGNKQFTAYLFNPTLNGLSAPSVLGTVTNTTFTIINDNGYGTFQFSAPSYLVNENGGNATITVTRTGSALGTAQVSYNTVNGSAIAGVNYVATNGNLTFAQKQISRTITVQILNDGKTNPPPSSFFFSVALSSPLPQPGASLGVLTNVPIDIVDAQSFNQPPGVLDPAFNTSMDNSVLSLALQSDGQVVAGGNFAFVNGSSRNGVARLNLDGSLDTGFLNGLAGADGTVNTVISQTDDRLVIGGNFANVDGTGRNRVARLMTDGSVDTSFNPAAGADNAVFALAETFVNGAREIFAGGAFTTFNGNSSHGVVRLLNDGTVDTAFTVGLGANGTVYSLAPYPTNSISNAGQVLVGGAFTNFNNFIVGNLVRLNGDGSVDTNFAQNLGANGAVRSIAIQTDGNIFIGGDFTSVNGTPLNHIARLNPDGSLDMTFASKVAGGINGTVSTITLQADNRIVIGGQFSQANGVTRHNLTRLLPTGAVDPTINFGDGANGAVNAVVEQPSNAMLVLGGAFTQFNDQPHAYIARIYGGSMVGSGSFEFTTSGYQVVENGQFATITVTRTGGTSGTNADGSGSVSVNFATTSGGTAVAGVNYTPVNNNLVFPAGEVFETIFVPVIDDMVITPNLTVNLGLTNPTLPADLGDQATAVLTIINVDSSVSFLSANYSVPKNTVNGVATIDIIRQGTTSGSCTVNFSTTTNGTATAGVDYYPTNALITFNPGDTDQTIQIPIINNTLPEGSRTVGLQLTNVVGTLLSSPSNAVLTIIDTVNAPGQLNFSATNYTVTSASGSANLTVVRTNGSSGSVSVNYVTVPGTAAPGSNYVNSSGTLTFADGQLSGNIQVPLINNPQVFQTTALSVQLFNPSAGATLNTPTNATVTILSANSGVAFQSATNYVSETNAVGLVFVQRLGLTNSVVHVNYATTNNGTAMAGINYLPVNGVLTFNVGETLKAVSVPVFNHNNPTNLTFGLNLSNPTTGTTLVSPSSALVIIQGSMAGLSFATNSVSVLKSGGNVIITVVCSNPANEPVEVDSNTVPLSVNYSTINGTAIAGVDYAAVSGTLVFTNGTSTNSFVVPIINNSQLEGNRSFNVQLSNPTPPGQLIAPTNETVTIIDSNVGLKFSQPTYSVLKTGLAATINVLRTGYTGSVVSVNYLTTNGTAIAGQNYLPASGTLVFTNGVTSQAFTVTILDNTAIQPDLTVLLQLTTPVNAALVYPSFGTLIIHDTSGSLVVPAGAVLVHEGFSPPNGIVDPGETNTVAFGFRASAGLNVSNLTATLIATNGVTFVNGASSVSGNYGSLMVGGHAVYQPFTFIANGTNAQAILATFNLQNGTNNLGTAAFTFTMGTWQVTASNTAPIVINDNAAASPYPSFISLNGLNGVVVKTTVTLTNVSHFAPGQIDALLVAPNQSDTLIMSHAGAGNSISHVTLNFDDATLNNLTQFGQIVSGTNKPTSYAPVPNFP